MYSFTGGNVQDKTYSEVVWGLANVVPLGELARRGAVNKVKLELGRMVETEKTYGNHLFGFVNSVGSELCVLPERILVINPFLCSTTVYCALTIC